MKYCSKEPDDNLLSFTFVIYFKFCHKSEFFVGITQLTVVCSTIVHSDTMQIGGALSELTSIFRQAPRDYYATPCPIDPVFCTL